MGTILVVAETAKGGIRESSYELVAIARGLAESGGHDVKGLVIGSGVGDLASQVLGLCGVGDEAQPIAKPLDGRPGNKDTSLQSISHLGVLAQLPGDGGQQSALRSYSLPTRVEEEETTRAVGVLGLARCITGLAK